MKFSIITVCRNAEKTIEEMLRSVAEQDYPDREHIVIDGASTDGTMAILQRYRDGFTYFVSEPDKGIYDAMLKGVALASGDYILFMNADDAFYDAGTLRKVAEKIGDKKALVAYGDIVCVDRRNAPGTLVRLAIDWVRRLITPSSGRSVLPTGEPGMYSYPFRYPLVDRYFFYAFCIPQQAIYYRADVFDIVGPLDASYRVAADYEWLLRAFFRFRVKPQHIHLFVTRFRLGGASSRPELYRTEKGPLRRRYYSFRERLLFGFLPFQALMRILPIHRAASRLFGWAIPHIENGSGAFQ